MFHQKLHRSYILRALKNELLIKLYLKCVSRQEKVLAPSFRRLEKPAQNILALRFLSARSYRVVNTMLLSI